MKIIYRLKAQTRRMRPVGCAAFFLSVFASTAFGQQFVLHDGDTVVFYGDSITAQRLYTRDVEEFVLTRYPKLHVRFLNAGVPGDTVNGGYAGTVAERVQRDVQPYHPTMITVMLGMNDGGWGYGPPDNDAKFQTGYHALLDALHNSAPAASVTLISPTTYDEITHGTEFPGYSTSHQRVCRRCLADWGTALKRQGQISLCRRLQSPAHRSAATCKNAISRARAAHRSRPHPSFRNRPLDHGSGSCFCVAFRSYRQQPDAECGTSRGHRKKSRTCIRSQPNHDWPQMDTTRRSAPLAA